MARLTLIAFLPFSIGCSSQHVIPLHSDPGTNADPLEGGKSIRITGYTTHSQGFQKWIGIMEAAPPDSLQFSRKVVPSLSESVTLRLSHDDVISVSVKDMHWGRMAALGFGVYMCLAVIGYLTADLGG
jgi:hypothetical protein